MPFDLHIQHKPNQSQQGRLGNFNPYGYTDLQINNRHFGTYWQDADRNKKFFFNRTSQLAVMTLPVPPPFNTKEELIAWILDTLDVKTFERLLKD